MDATQVARSLSCSQLGGCYKYTSKDSLMLRLHRGMHREAQIFLHERLGGEIEVEVRKQVGEFELVGHIDLITAKGNIIEIKTTSRKEIREEWTLQVKGYLMLVGKEKGYIVTVNPWGIVKTYEVRRDDEEVLRWIDFFFAPECGRCLKFKYCKGGTR